MSNNKDELSRLISDAFATKESGIQCDEAVFQMARAATANLHDIDVKRQFIALWQHLELCTNCTAEFNLLQEVMQAESVETRLHIPPPPDNGRFPIWQLAKNALHIQFPGFSPAFSHALTRGEELGVEPTTVPLPIIPFSIEFDVGINEDDSNQRDLFITFLNDSPTQTETVEGRSLWLQKDIRGPILQEQVLDELGDATFTHIHPGNYTLRLHLPKQQYIISPITLP